MSLNSVDEVQAWVDANGGEEGLRIALRKGVFGNDANKLAHTDAWLRREVEARAAKLDAEEQALRLREVVASEASAEASKLSAESAHRAARWAVIAALIALAALVIPFFRK